MGEPGDTLHDDPLRTAIGVLTDIRVNETEHPDEDRQREDSRQHSREAAKKETPEIL